MLGLHSAALRHQVAVCALFKNVAGGRSLFAVQGLCPLSPACSFIFLLLLRLKMYHVKMAWLVIFRNLACVLALALPRALLVWPDL